MKSKLIHRILVFSLICILLVLSSCSQKTGLNQIDTSKKNIELISKHGVIEFKKDVWKTNNSESRGKMLKSLFNQESFVGDRNKSIFSLLGHSTCYIDYEDQPCYEIIYDEKYYFLVFYVYHSTDKAGTISNIKFFERD